LWVNEGEEGRCERYAGDRSVKRSQRHMSRSQFRRNRGMRNRQLANVGQRRKLPVSRRRYPKQFGSKAMDFRRSSELGKYRRTVLGEKQLQNGKTEK